MCTIKGPFTSLEIKSKITTRYYYLTVITYYYVLMIRRMITYIKGANESHAVNVILDL